MKTKTTSIKNLNTARFPVTIKQPFSVHLQELRLRLLQSLLIFLILSGVGYFFRNNIITLLLSPLSTPLYYSSPAGGFDFTLKIALFFGLVTSIPFFIYQILEFIEPALPQYAQKRISLSLITSSALMLLGILFGYFLSLPAALHFLSSFGSSQVQSLISANEYFSFVTRYLLGFGILFQLPFMLVTINQVKKLSLKTLLSYERYVILGTFIIAAIITPTPDIFNQTVMALPIILLYQITIAIIYAINRRK